MPMTASQLQGQTVGHLYVVEATSERNHNKTIMWRCKCTACGVEKLLPSTKLKSGEVQSCGCQEHTRSARTPPGQTGLKGVLKNYQQGAAARNLHFGLSLLEFKSITSGDCRYCGIPPSQVYYGSQGAKREHGKYVYNGVDRVDNTQGYTLENCVPCCGTCNMAKRTMEEGVFLDWISRVYKKNFTNS